MKADKMLCSHRHPFTRGGRLTASIGAALHLRIIRGESLAGIGTPTTCLGTDVANSALQVGTSKHEVGGGTTNLRAVEQQPDVVRRGVCAAHLETVRNGFDAEACTGQAIADALLHLSGLLLVWHVYLPRPSTT